MKFGKNLFAILLGAALFSACGRTGTVQPTLTRTPAPTLQNRPTSTPTEVLYYTITATTFPTFDATATAWEVSQEATYEYDSTAFMPFPNRCKDEEKSNSLLSPDGTWFGEACFLGELRALKRDGSAKVILTYDDLFGSIEYVCSPAIHALHWTKDNRYLYYIRDVGCWEGDYQPELGIVYEGPLFRLDTLTGEWAAILGTDLHATHYYSFSPTDRRIVSSVSDGLVILDLKTGEQQSLTFPDAANSGSSVFKTGAVVWSPDGLALAFTTLQVGELFNPDKTLYSVYIYDIKNKTLKTVLKDTKERRLPQTWTADNILEIPLVEDRFSYAPIPGHTLYYNISGQSFITPTPTP